ncbi:putative 5-formyltetrahydrofolate cyclo-ligase [Aurantiacibacter atlanticus]|uniref:5-formyltetrahydrofolate cyclo-ligase n=1 Tax=Aurantiacibacter atlanticus TaxID=1648404 RepID=A0A0H4VFX2_9SPHN|nr:5-formyltetrahydrofolate cyclo-ligase [Aurantiacibacter atlanticus]AKQ42009.1 putative 5-formyltetrahydrofolate cyclo-ligase [Aurantiacibacter atlanticus]MDF1835290.1 5-formyltetrahydrofolate cyclo-ligase [Alteraurantiacibacter sp. bin_em_oilr2.035]
MSDQTKQKADLRKSLRLARREHAASLPPEVSALVFRRPPGPVLDMIPDGATIGLYHANDGEAPAGGYARYFVEAGHAIALPRVTSRQDEMQFHLHSDPFGDTDLEEGSMGMMQPAPDAQALTPDVLFVPLLGFTDAGGRIGQGGGHYDRWLAKHPDTTTIGLAWDVQRVDELPLENHDMPLTAIITPTRIYGPF